MTISVTYLDDGQAVVTGLPGPGPRPVLLTRTEQAELYLALRGSDGIPTDVLVEAELNVPVHRCPLPGEGIMPCCGLPPGDRLGHRMTTDDAQVTCNAAVSAFDEPASAGPECPRGFRHQPGSCCSQRCDNCGRHHGPAECEPEAVWSLRRIYDVLDRLALQGDEDASRDRQTAKQMLRWHVMHSEAEAAATAEAPARTRADALRGHLKAAHEHLCSAQVHCVIVASRAQLGEAIDRISFVAGREGVDPGDTFTARDVIDAVIEGEFTDAQAAMIVALVATMHALDRVGTDIRLNLPHVVKRAADVVRMARGADTPGWDEADLIIAIESL